MLVVIAWLGTLLAGLDVACVWALTLTKLIAAAIQWIETLKEAAGWWGHEFCDTFLNGDPTDAAFQLMRNLTLLANREQKVRATNVVTSIIKHLPRRFDDE